MDSQYKQFENTAELMKAVAHPLRICILNGLRESPNITVSEMNTCLENVPQSTLSQHLSVLRRAGLIKAEHRGKYVEYELANEKVERFIKILLNEGLV
jgi:ArsR family transcriptional regulator